jgi:chromosome segregation ATPase
MTDDELRALVARNAEAIDRTHEAIDRNAETIDRNAKAIDRLDLKTAAIDRQIESTQRQIDLLVEQTRSLADNQVINETRFTRAERQIQGIYDILGTFAKEQAARSNLIDQQIQSLIDERRRS